MILTAAEETALERNAQQIGVFFRLFTDPVVRLWLGIGKIAPGVDSPVTDEIYRGFGELGTAPGFKQLINGAAERVDFTLSGVSPEILALAATESETVKNVDCDLGFAIMDSDWALLGPVRWVRHFVADYLTVNEQESEVGLMRTIALSVGTVMTGRKRMGLSYCSDADQQLRSVGDTFFERTSTYTQQGTKRWPVP